MKRIYFLMVFLGLFGALDAQVAYSELFLEDHEGKVYFDETQDSISYKWEFKEQKQSKYFAEGNTVEKSRYVLELELQDETYHMDVDFRNLIVSLYIELKLPLKSGTRTITGIYQKGQRWIKVKGVVDSGCSIKNESSWGRKNNIQNFDQILEFYVQSLISNINFSDCIESR